MEKVIPIEAFHTSDFRTAIDLSSTTDLSIRAFFNNSLTNYLHQLAPQLSVDELTENGNYSFSFYVNNQLIYTENLNPGSESSDTKNKHTSLRIPLISSTNEDAWGRFLWIRFMMSGGREALTENENLLKIEIRPYLKLNEILLGEIIGEGQIIVRVPVVQIDADLLEVQTIQPAT